MLVLLGVDIDGSGDMKLIRRIINLFRRKKRAPIIGTAVLIHGRSSGQKYPVTAWHGAIEVVEETGDKENPYEIVKYIRQPVFNEEVNGFRFYKCEKAPC